MLETRLVNISERTINTLIHFDNKNCSDEYKARLLK
jgi:hypothetical protein